MVSAVSFTIHMEDAHTYIHKDRKPCLQFAGEFPRGPTSFCTFHRDTCSLDGDLRSGTVRWAEEVSCDGLMFLRLWGGVSGVQRHKPWVFSLAWLDAMIWADAAQKHTFHDFGGRLGICC